MLTTFRLLAAVALFALVPAAPAQAHARYESSDPADGATVASPPSEVLADFSEPVTSASYLEVTDPCGDIVSGASRPTADKVAVSMSGTRAGRYSVFFSVQSSIDSHTTEGTFSFTSSGGDPCPGTGSSGGADAESTGAGNGSGGGSDTSGSGGSGGTGGGGSAGGDGSTSADAAGAPSDPAPVSDGGRSGGKGRGKHAGHASKQGGGDAGTGSRDVPLAVEREDAERGAPGPWDLPMDALVIALSIAALIGAAGGAIYAAILGPRP